METETGIRHEPGNSRDCPVGGEKFSLTFPSQVNWREGHTLDGILHAHGSRHKRMKAPGVTRAGSFCTFGTKKQHICEE